jgi:hypothetical protein
VRQLVPQTVQPQALRKILAMRRRSSTGEANSAIFSDYFRDGDNAVACGVAATTMGS